LGRRSVGWAGAVEPEAHPSSAAGEAKELKRPLICVSSRLDPNVPNFYLKRSYTDALYKSGAAPVMVPLIPDREYVVDLVGRCQGVVLSGSDSDVDPDRYGQSPHPKLGHILWERDETDQLLLEAAGHRRLPVLAICYGVQALNVYRGGTLFQDIESQVAHAIKHEQGLPYERLSHKIAIREGTVLAELAGGTSARVNSHHHQAVDRVGDGLEPIAWADDGLIEAVVSTASDQFILGVQWHPEACYESDRFSRAIFDRFVKEVISNSVKG
jgi:putative glutamine amidotransferase